MVLTPYLHVISGEVRIGIITFDMLISVNSSYMRPNLSEVAEFIAHEFEIANLQVWSRYYAMAWLTLYTKGLLVWLIFARKLILVKYSVITVQNLIKLEQMNIRCLVVPILILVCNYMY